MQPRTRGIGEHVQQVDLLALAARLAGIGRLEGPLPLPPVLPAPLDLLGQRRAVAERGIGVPRRFSRLRTGVRAHATHLWCSGARKTTDPSRRSAGGVAAPGRWSSTG